MKRSTSPIRPHVRNNRFRVRLTTFRDGHSTNGQVTFDYRKPGKDGSKTVQTDEGE